MMRVCISDSPYGEGGNGLFPCESGALSIACKYAEYAH